MKPKQNPQKIVAFSTSRPLVVFCVPPASDWLYWLACHGSASRRAQAMPREWNGLPVALQWVYKKDQNSGVCLRLLLNSVGTYVHTCMHPRIHTSMHPYIHTSIHACMHACIHLDRQTDIQTYIIYVYICVCVLACVCVYFI